MSSLIEMEEENKKDQEMTHLDPLSQSIVNNEFIFQQSISVHQGSVRSLTVLHDSDALVSGSIDKSTKLFQINKSDGKYQFDREFVYHESFIYAVLASVDSNGFFSASKDKKIYHIDSFGNPSILFEGHEGAVNSLSQAIPEELVSGSWDGTARVWNTKTGECKYVLEGHSYAVSVLVLPNGIIVTGSQDKSLRIWFQGQLQKEIKNAHDDIIRQLTEVPGVGFASCSNDELVKMWTIDGNLIRTFNGHQGFVFTLIYLASGELASAGDDCSVIIWNISDGSKKQTLLLPRTVWTLTQNSIGDLIVGSEDYKIRTFTRDHSRADFGDALKEFEQELQSKSTSTDMEQFAKAPDVSEQSKIQGKGEGDIQVFKKNGVPSAYMWKSIEKKWEYVGEVVDPSAQGASGGQGFSQQKYYEGDKFFPAGEYDYIFDVDLGQGIMSKLPFNAGDNMITAAEKFCVREQLSRSHIDQIQRFISQNTIPQKGAPSQSNKQIHSKQQYVEEKDNTMRQVLLYDAVKIEGPQKKILEFNNEDNFMDGKDLKTFERMCNSLSNKNNFWQTKLDVAENELLKKLLSLPIQKVFPSLDIYRIFLMHPDSTLHYKKFEEGVSNLFSLMGILENKEAGDPAKMLSLRCIVNLFRDSSAQFVLRERRQKVIACISPHLNNSKANVVESAITVILNYSVIFLLKDDPEGRIQCITALSSLLQSKSSLDDQCQKRLAAAVNNLTFKYQDGKSLAKSVGLL